MAKTTYRQCPRCGNFSFNVALGVCERAPCEPDSPIRSLPATVPTPPKSDKRATDAPAGGTNYALVGTLHGHTDAVTSLAFCSTAHSLVSGSDDKTVRLWNWEISPSPQLLDEASGRVWSLAVAPSARLLAIGTYEVGIHDLADGRCIERSPISIGWVTSLAIASDGKLLVAGGEDATVALWRMNPLERYPMGESQLLSGHDNPVRSVTIGLSSTVLATASESDGTVNLWRLPDGTRLSTFKIERFVVPVLSMGPDGVLAIGNASSGRIELRKASRSGQVESLGELSGHSAGVLALAIDNSSRFAVSGGFDKTTRVWDLASRILLATLSGHSDRVSCVAISEDGAVVASGSNSGTICVWRRS